MNGIFMDGMNNDGNHGSITLALARSAITPFNGASPWYTELAAGTPSQGGLRFMFDTGTTHTWVTSSLCSTKACSFHRKFNQNSSSTFKYRGEKTEIDFGPWGSMSVRLCEEIIHINGLSLNMRFFEAEQYEGTQFETLAWDGAIAIPSIIPEGIDSTLFLNMLQESGIISDRVISFFHSQEKYNAACVIGKAPSDDMNRVKLVRFDNDPECWTIPLDSITACGSGVILEDIPLALDTGSSFFKGDGYFIWKIINRITNRGLLPSVIFSPDSIDNYPFKDLVLSIQGKEYRLTPKQYFMQTAETEWRLAFYPMQGLEGLLLAGSVFLETVNCTFDFDRQMIGLASKNNSGYCI